MAELKKNNFKNDIKVNKSEKDGSLKSPGTNGESKDNNKEQIPKTSFTEKVSNVFSFINN